ncbi:hypothetical protein BDV24DRAFT_170210 [Aspergillus arachidicola]|uniref:Uncharacterized protein n=1 Tax=Aspergillus arachidicola TaxID=656916 RepID=A0A5N6XN94_9EURO|nr:hypothetical protein BDV24DRAFT_170210 [Aspergillus arachidicola]
MAVPATSMARTASPPLSGSSHRDAYTAPSPPFSTGGIYSAVSRTPSTRSTGRTGPWGTASAASTPAPPGSPDPGMNINRARSTRGLAACKYNMSAATGGHPAPPASRPATGRYSVSAAAHRGPPGVGPAPATTAVQPWGLTGPGIQSPHCRDFHGDYNDPNSLYGLNKRNGLYNRNNRNGMITANRDRIHHTTSPPRSHPGNIVAYTYPPRHPNTYPIYIGGIPPPAPRLCNPAPARPLLPVYPGRQ